MNIRILFFFVFSITILSGCASTYFNKSIEIKPDIGYMGKLGENINYEIATDSKWIEIKFKNKGKTIYQVMINDQANIESYTALAEETCCSNVITLHVKNGVITDHSMWKEEGSKQIILTDKSGDFLPDKRIITDGNSRKEESINYSFKEIQDSSNSR